MADSMHLEKRFYSLKELCKWSLFDFSIGHSPFWITSMILSVHRENVQKISVKADVKSMSQNNTADNFKKYRI